MLINLSIATVLLPKHYLQDCFLFKTITRLQKTGYVCKIHAQEGIVRIIHGHFVAHYKKTNKQTNPYKIQATEFLEC